MESEIIVTKFNRIMSDSIAKGKPYIPISPRETCALAYIVEGNLRYIVGEQSTVIYPGEVVFIEPGYIDSAEAYLCERVSYVTVDFYVLHTDFSLDTRIRLRDGDKIYNLFGQIEQCYLSGTYNRIMKCMEIFYTLLNAVIENNISSSDNILLNKNNRIAPTVSYIHTHYNDQNISVSGLAKDANMSEVNLNRLFRELYGMTVSAYIQRIRVQHAKTLLENSVTHVGEVAQATGYIDVYTFSHAFKRETGLSPTDWRYRKK